MQIRSSDLEIPTNDPFENDCLDRRELEPPLTQFVTQAVGPFVLAVDGSWGSGKTTFLKMWQVKLDDAGHLCLYLNAWKTDFVQDPLVAVVGELSIAIKKHSLALLNKNSVDETIENIDKTARSIVKRLIPTVVKIGTLGVISESTTEKIMTDLKGETAQDYENGKLDIEKFRENLSFLATMIQESSEKPIKIVIIIDELDRCRPTYAVQLLERIKHLFDVEGVVFILGIDRHQLSHSVKALYGSEFDAPGYLKRFIDIDYNLPDPSTDCYCLSLFKRFGIDSLLSKRNPEKNNYDLYALKAALGYLMSSAQMSLRDQEQVVSRLRVVLQTISRNERIYPITLSIFLFLRYCHYEQYLLVIKGAVTAKNFLSFLETLPNEKEAFKVFSRLDLNIRDARFSKDLIEGVFLAGLNELLGTYCPEMKEYTKLQESNNSFSSKLEYKLNIAISEVGFKQTEKRLNLTSNFVRNELKSIAIG
jgi:KAP family P-loop domain